MKQTRKKSLVVCPVCNKEYLKDDSEINRNFRLNRKSYCSQKCAGHDSYLNNKESINSYLYSEDNLKHLKKLNVENSTRADKNKYTNFRYYLRYSVKKRQECTIDLDYLVNLWEKQGGKCPYTNIDLKLKRFDSKADFDNPFIQASLDRIDSSKGYIPGNVEFVSLGINFMKNKFSKQSVLDFLELIKKS
jgi:hypothetical protein